MKQIITIGYLNKTLWGGAHPAKGAGFCHQRRRHFDVSSGKLQPSLLQDYGDSALRGEFTWKGKHLDPWSGFQWNTSPAFSIPSLKDLSKTLRCDDTMCVMEIVRYERAEADNSGQL